MSFTASLKTIVSQNRNGLLGSHSSWCRVELAEVAAVLNGYPFPSERFTRGTGMPLLRIRDVQSDTTEAFFDGPIESAYVVEPGSLVVGMDGDFNAALWRGPHAALNQRVCKITPREAFYDKRFMAYVLPGYLSAINAETSSVTVKHLSSKTVSEIPLPLPPISEQRRIVAAIEEQFTRLDAAVASLQRARATLRRYRAALFSAAIEGRLVRTQAELARTHGAGHENAAQLLARVGVVPKAIITARDELPEGWARTHLGAIAELKGGITKGQKRTARDVLRPVPYLRVANVQRGYLDLREIKTIDATEQEIADLRLHAGDVLFNEGGDRDKLGRGWIWRGEIPECIHQNHVFRARLRSQDIDSKYVSWYSNAAGQAYFLEQGKQTTNLASINLTKLAALPISFPPAEEQRRIVAELERRLSAVEELEASVEANLKRAERLRQSILKRAFDGKLVPQDPTDEPAGALLDRIRNERASPNGTVRPPRRGTNRGKQASPARPASLPISSP